MSVNTARAFHYFDLRKSGHSIAESKEIVEQYEKLFKEIESGLSDKEAISKIID